MNTVILKGEEALVAGARLIRDGEVVAFPTETVYGLGADAFNPAAVKKIFEAKGRPNDNPLIVHVADKADIALLAAEISPASEALIDAFMPGPITLIMPRRPCVPDCVTAGLETVGIRMPSHPVAGRFISTCGVPIAAPSANASTKVSPTSAAHVAEDMNGKIPLIIDGGESRVGIESTIVDTSVDIPTVLRKGAITEEMLARVLGEVRTFTGKIVVAKAPGMKYRHYAPTCGMVIARDMAAAEREYDSVTDGGGRAVIICPDAEAAGENGRRVYALGASDEEIMRGAYAALRDCEKRFDEIIALDLGECGARGSVMERYNKSAGGKRV